MDSDYYLCHLASLFDGITLNAPSIGAIVAIVLAAILLFCSGFVSASEIAFFSLSPKDMSDVKQSGKNVDKRIVDLLDESERLLATILISNNFVNVTIIMLCNYFFSNVVDFGTSEIVEFLVLTVLLTFLLLLFGEIIPKIYSAQNTLPFARMAAPILIFLRKVFYPLSSMLMHSTFIVNRMVSKEDHNISVDELSQALELTDREEIKEERNILQGIIRFGDETAKEVMTSRLDMVDLDIKTSYSQVLKTIVENRYSRMPVYEGSQDNIKGVLYIKDLLPHLNKGDNFRWQSLIRQAYFVPETKMIDDLLRDFQKNRIHIAVVVDEFGGTSGIITLEDIIEEIVGEINDESDEEERQYVKVGDNVYVFEAKILLADFYKVLDTDYEEFESIVGEADTLAGLLLEIKGEFPKLHEQLTFGRYDFEILEMDDRRILKVKVQVNEQVASTDEDNE
ncbi:MAG: gliding motility-associated protein GldE [Bacteroidaceae bacterium]|nr:gliding motility-associated protein GldE [Bacteroidaceae bacterium]